MQTLVSVLILAVVLASAQPQWRVLKPDYEPVLVGVSFLDEKVGFMSGGQNGEPPVGGPQVYKSLDGGVSWEWLPHSGFAMMFLDVAMDTKTNGVTAGVGILVVPGIEYTLTGNNFNRTLEVEFIEECQSTEVVKGVPGAFGLAGDFGKTNGVAVSFDKGQRFAHFDANLTTISRYGAYPSRTTWYVSAGDWPSQERDNAPGVHALTQRIRVKSTLDENKNWIKNGVEIDLEPAVDDENAGYDCNIARTTDGGRTWSMLFETQDFYPNGISCPTVNNCWVVGEASHGDGAGIHILHTTNGGRTWETQLRNTNPHFSLIALDFINELEGWAGGGELAATHIVGHFWHTVNGGKNWTLETVPGVYPNDFSFVNRGHGWATAFTIHGLSALLAYS